MSDKPDKKQIKKLLEESGKIEDLRKSEISIKDFICFLRRNALNNQCSPEHLIKEKAANAGAMSIAKESGASLQSLNEMARILNKQSRLTEEFNVIENYNSYGRF